MTGECFIHCAMPLGQVVRELQTMNLFFNLSLDGELKSDKEEMSSSTSATFLSTFAKLPLLTDEMSDNRRSFRAPGVGGLA